jgi:hypothetical protein
LDKSFAAEKDMLSMNRFFLSLAFMGCVTAAQAQTKPAVMSLGPDFPNAVIFIGNSFFITTMACRGT